MAGTKLINLMS